MNNFYCCQRWLTFILSKIVSVWQYTPLGPSGYVTVLSGHFLGRRASLRGRMASWHYSHSQPWSEASCGQCGMPHRAEFLEQMKKMCYLSLDKIVRQKIEFFMIPSNTSMTKAVLLSISVSYFPPSQDTEAKTSQSRKGKQPLNKLHVVAWFQSSGVTRGADWWRQEISGF